MAVTEHWTAFVPYAARWPSEVHVAPHRECRTSPTSRRAGRPGRLNPTDVLGRLDRSIPRGRRSPGVALHLRLAPGAGARRPRLSRLHLQVFSIRRAPGKLKYLAGSESAMGAWVNDTSPERVPAARLREVA